MIFCFGNSIRNIVRNQKKAILNESIIDRPSSNQNINENEYKAKYLELDEKFAALRQQYLELKNDLRLTQERQSNEIKKAKLFAAQPFAKDLFTVYDTLLIAIKHTNAGELSERQSEGFEMIRKQMISVFKNHNLHLIDPKVGEKFNHDLHEAVYQMNHTQHDDGSIGVVETVGFQLNDRVLRAAKVGVVKK
eukprot:NODE_42_length_34079_cov_0.552619.p11 type:complete len:192 gc:universal NODE_42_length_34079_cov_0.552619:4530-3955(-)